MGKIVQFIKECYAELRKVVWPGRDDVISSVKVVIISTLIIAVVLVTGLGLRFGPLITVTLGGYSVPIDRLGIAIGALLGVFLNIVLPGEKFEFGKKKE